MQHKWWKINKMLVKNGRKEKECVATIIDKSLGTNLHLWRFFTRIHLHLFSPSFNSPSYNVGRMYTLFLQSLKQRMLKSRASFWKIRFKKTPKINEITQVSQGILSTILWFSRCFLALNAVRTRECKHLRLEMHFYELLDDFSVHF